MGTRHWTQSYADIPAEIDADRYASMVDLLDAALERHASRPAFKAFGQTLNYADVDRLSRSFASYLQNKLGVRQGDRVAVMMPNLLAFPVTLLGIMRAGAVQVNVNPLYTPRELEHQLNDAGVETIVVFSGSTPTLAEVRANTGLKTVITVAVGDASGATLPSPPVDALLGESVSFAEALAQGGGLPLQPVALTGDDLLFLQYTGGTTGLSKGAALSHRNLVANTEQFKAFMPVAVKEGEEVLVTAIPLYHIFALMVSLSYLSVGAENWLVANPRDMDGFVGVLAQARPTVFMGVNTLYGGLVQHPKLGEVDWSRLKIAIGGGAAVVGAVSDRWKAITGHFIREGYGLSETSPVVSFNPAYITEFIGRRAAAPAQACDAKLAHGAQVQPGDGLQLAAAQLRRHHEGRHHRDRVGLQQHVLEHGGAVADDAQRLGTAGLCAGHGWQGLGQALQQRLRHLRPGPGVGQQLGQGRRCGGCRQRMAGAAHGERRVRLQRRDLDGIERLHLTQLGQHQIDVARAKALGQLLPGRDDDLHAQLRVLPAQPTHGRPDQRGAHERPGADAQRAQLGALGQLHVAHHLLRAQHPVTRVIQQQMADGRGRDLAAAAVEQLRVERGFERLDAARERRLGEMQRVGRAGVVAVLGQGQQMTEVPGFDHDACQLSKR